MSERATSRQSMERAALERWEGEGGSTLEHEPLARQAGDFQGPTAEDGGAFNARSLPPLARDRAPRSS